MQQLHAEDLRPSKLLISRIGVETIMTLIATHVVTRFVNSPTDTLQKQTLSTQIVGLPEVVSAVANIYIKSSTPSINDDMISGFIHVLSK